MAAQKEPTDITEKSSDFLTFDRVKSPTTDTVENVAQDVRSLLADTEKIKDFISCRRCKNEFDKDSHRPLLLPCLGGICKMCTLDLQATGKISYECAKCLSEHVCLTDNVVTLQTDVTRELLSEMYHLLNEESSLLCEMCTNHQTASHRCVDCCHFICTDCVNLHGILRQFKSHSVLELKNLLTEKIENLRLFFSTSSKQCPVIGHEKENAILFCFSTSCEKPICMRCAITTHKDHEFRDISEVGKESENEVQNQIGDLLTKADLACVSLTRLTDLQEKNTKKSQELQIEIKNYFNEAKQALELREKALLDVVSAQLNNEQTSIENEKKRLTSFVGSCKETCYYGRISSEFNSTHSFLDVAESIKSRIKILGDQPHENQFIIETMKFSSEPSSTSHAKTIKTLGKLSVSKVIASKSTAVITPSVYEIQQEVHFKIQLLSSLGKPIIDEDVNVHLEINRQTFSILQCVLDKSSASYFGSWIPDKSMQIAWIVVSNGIRIETLQGVLNVKNQTQKPNMNDLKDLASASGEKSFLQRGKDGNESKIKGIAEKRECLVSPTGKNCFEKPGKLLQINVEKNLFGAARTFINVLQIAMSQREYSILMFFAKKRNWFSQYWNSISYDGTGLVCEIPTDDEKHITEDIKKYLEMVKCMVYINIVPNDDSKQLIQNVQDKFPNVCFIWNDKTIDIISENYEDALKVQELLLIRRNKRAGRRYAKADTSEAQEALPSSNDSAGNTYETNAPNSQTMAQPRALEIKTKEGLLIKIYVGSITRLDVDCIVNAANEQLMHGGGVAATISEAAGYQFDMESQQYVKDHGPIPVGSCCVTSAGRLPYKCVIHTVGPRWSGYRDSDICLKLLQKSVEVTFTTADEKGMSSVAIPAISWGIFGVPKEMCVEQYYRAAMSFCSTYPYKNLREIHFVDRDESTVKAIQEAFRQRQPFGPTVLKKK